MKKSLMIVLAVLISVAFVTTVFAQAPKAAPAPAPAPEKAAPAPAKDAKAAPAPEKAKEAAPKAKAAKFAGEVVSFEAGKTMVVKGKDGEKTFDVAAVKKEFKAGDKVTVMFTEKDGKLVASKVAAAKKAAEKKEAKPAEKPAPEKAAPAPEKAAPAPAPAPAKK